MADPITWLMIAGTALGGVGTIQAANAASASADYNAQLADRDAFVEDQNRQIGSRQTQIAADDKRRENRRRMSSIRAQYGASGLEMAGSPLDVLEDTAVENELDVARIEYDGRVRSRNGALQMLGLQESGNLSRMESSSAKRAGTIGAIGTVTYGAGTTLSRTA